MLHRSFADGGAPLLGLLLGDLSLVLFVNLVSDDNEREGLWVIGVSRINKLLSPLFEVFEGFFIGDIVD